MCYIFESVLVLWCTSEQELLLFSNLRFFFTFFLRASIQNQRPNGLVDNRIMPPTFMLCSVYSSQQIVSCSLLSKNAEARNISQTTINNDAVEQVQLAADATLSFMIRHHG